MENSSIEIKSWRRFLKRNSNTLIPIIGLVGLLVIFAIFTHGRILGSKNLLLILNQAYVLLIASVGVFFIMTMGGLDFSQGSIVGVAGIVIAYACRVSLPLAIALGILTGALIGLLNGLLNVYLKIPSFIVTICTMFLFRGVVKYLTTDSPVSAPIWFIQMDSPAIKIPITLTVLILGYIVYRYTKVGTILKSIGAGETGARYSGIPVSKVKVLVFMIAGALTGLAAFINLLKVGSITASGGNLVETNVLIALVLGGLPITGGAKANFAAVVVGSILYAVMNNGLVMLKLDPTTQQLIQGLIFLLVVTITTDRKAGMIK